MAKQTDNRTDKEILDEIDELASGLGYTAHRYIQEDLCEILKRLKKNGKTD